MKKLYCAASLQEATLLLDMLIAHRIPAQLLNTFAQGGMGELPFTHTYPEIWIEDERDLLRAQNLIIDYEKQPDKVQIISCPKCGENCPENFGICWSCGKSIHRQT